MNLLERDLLEEEYLGGRIHNSELHFPYSYETEYVCACINSG